MDGPALDACSDTGTLASGGLPTSYENPLVSRYASAEMSRIFSPAFKFTTWRRLWLALAESQRELGLDIPAEAIAQMRERLDRIDLERAGELERRVRHDVMAHVLHFGEVAPAARAVIHLGATSAYVTDNTELLQHREAMALVRQRLLACIEVLARFARRWKDLPTLGYTHFQPAQPTTVGKRATLWIQDLLLDLEDVEHRLGTMCFRGARGTTGTEASFLELFGGDAAKVRALNEGVARRMGFERLLGVTGQTYTRKLDYGFQATLASVATSASKFAYDLRLLAHEREVEEPYQREQIGSSAMPYKRNPMRAERIDSLARHVITLSLDAAFTAATQWLERSLDDSANRRVAIPEAYLGTDAILLIVHNVAAGLIVRPEVVLQHLRAELPFMASEAILMQGVRLGGDRQTLHERIRQHAVAASERLKLGEPNDLVERLAADPELPFSRADIERLLDPARHVGRAPAQVEEFLTVQVDPVLARQAASARPDHADPPPELRA